LHKKQDHELRKERDYKVRRATSKRTSKEIGLPPDWCRYNNIEVGDTLTVIVVDSTLVYFPKKDEKTEETEEKGQLIDQEGQHGQIHNHQR
jgi:hypothetical protein